MDPICHTLAGGLLAETGLKRRTALGTLTLVAGANVPDIDVFIAGFGSVHALEFRRGWTHGVLAMAALPVGLAIIMWILDRLVRRRGRAGGEAARLAPLLALSAIAVGSHYALDFLNTYGIRLLMPFSSRWFYGDALFILDPWMWIILTAGIVGTRWRVRRDRPRPDRPARVALGIATTYALLMFSGGAVARQFVLGAMEERRRPARIMVAPVWANPFRRDVVLDMGTHYELGVFHWLPAPRFSIEAGRIPKNHGGAVVEAARRLPSARAFLVWARFPFFVVESAGHEARVYIGDMRWYRRRLLGDWPSVTVQLPSDYSP